MDEILEKLNAIIQRIYLEDDIPWVIGYSGGKDSTAALQVVWNALHELPEEQRNKKAVHVVSTNTLIESPVISKWVADSIDKLRKKSEAENMPIVPHHLRPQWNDTFWVNLLGRGYPYPRPTMRWCTDRLKIKPANKFVQEVVSAYGEVILVLGTRKAESANRARTMEYYEKKRAREYLSPNGSIQNELVFSPLEDWSHTDVWNYLLSYENPWGQSNEALLEMYQGATMDFDGEEALVMNASSPAWGKSRFGCWMCTMVEKDKSMVAMIRNDVEKRWMTPLMEFRNEIADAEKDRERRDFRRMTGSTLLYKGRLVHGPYKKAVREEWLRRLLEIQCLIREIGPQGFEDIELITMQELNCIRHIWLNDKHEFNDSLPRIYEEVTGEKFTPTEMTGQTSFGSAEWDLLSSVCKDLFPDEELLFETVARIVDIESQATEQKARRGVIKSVETQLKKGFYKNEQDAQQYAMDKIQRKKKMGASYDVEAEDNSQMSIFEEEDL